MSSRTPLEALEAFATPLQQAISLVIPAGRGVFSFYPRPLREDAAHWLAFPQEQPIRLSGSSLYLGMRHGFRIVESASKREPYRVTTTSYFYTLLDRTHRELLAYHFHPNGAGWCAYPHLHVGTARGIVDNKAHLITAPVSLQAFIRMLIEDPAFPVEPLRPDWERVLDFS